MGESHKQAAKIAKVSAQTISEWMQQPAFKAKINEIQLDTLNEAQGKFRGLACSAVANLEKALTESKSERIRLEASKYVLDRVQIAPAKEGGLWLVGPTTPEEIESEEHVRAVRKRLMEIKEELKLPFF